MIISFHTRELLETCSSLERAEQLLGARDAQILVGLLADIEAFDNGGDLIDFFGDEARIGAGDSLCLQVGANCVTFVAVGAKLARSVGGTPDWIKVQRLKLVEISRR